MEAYSRTGKLPNKNRMIETAMQVMSIVMLVLFLMAFMILLDLIEQNKKNG